MWRNIIDGSLLISIFALGAMVFRERIAQFPLDQDIERISQFLGEMPITNPKKAYFKALPSKRPHEYMWRVYLPKGWQLQHRVNYDGVGGSGAQQFRVEPARETVLKARLGFNSEFVTHQIYWAGSCSCGFNRIQPSLLTQHMQLANPKSAFVIQTGSEQAIEVENGEKLKLLSVSQPIKGQPQFKEVISVDISTGDPTKLKPLQ